MTSIATGLTEEERQNLVNKQVTISTSDTTPEELRAWMENHRKSK
jgi:hypothetical protein